MAAKYDHRRNHCSIETAEHGGSGEAGSTDPLLQIPDELSAVLTLKRGFQIRRAGAGSGQVLRPIPPDPAPSGPPRGGHKTFTIGTATSPARKTRSGAAGAVLPPDAHRTPLMKKKRESIV